MKFILFWIVPPVVGAFIGYITNAVAIKMLFRPLKEIRLFGFRVPFTPGILPKERRKLADSIGRMVDQELLTPGVLRKRLASTEVQEKIKNSLGAYTGQMLGRPLSYWLEERPGDFPLSGVMKDFVNSDVFDTFLEEIIRSMILGSPDDSEKENSLGAWLKTRMRNFGSVLISPARNMIKNGISREITSSENGNLPAYQKAMKKLIEKYPGITLGEFLSLGEFQKHNIDSFLADKAVGSLDENIEAALSSVNVKIIVAERINSLDMLRVEKIILDVLAGQLQWINIFGGILGGLIGFFQVLFTFFTGLMG